MVSVFMNLVSTTFSLSDFLGRFLRLFIYLCWNIYKNLIRLLFVSWWNTFSQNSNKLCFMKSWDWPKFELVGMGGVNRVICGVIRVIKIQKKTFPSRFEHRALRLAVQRSTDWASRTQQKWKYFSHMYKVSDFLGTALPRPFWGSHLMGWGLFGPPPLTSVL